jgi:HlyD family type I secretion membrane fusion protein
VGISFINSRRPCGAPDRDCSSGPAARFAARKGRSRNHARALRAPLTCTCAALVLAATFSPSVSGAQDGVARPTLPAPSGAPQSIDPAGDPLLRFMARTGGAEDFGPAIARAVMRHPSVGQAIAVRTETVQDRVEAKAELIPQLNVNLSSESSLARNFGRDSGNVFERSRPVSRVDAILSGEQLLYDFGATQQRIKAAKARIKASEADVADVATSAALNALSAYYQVLTSQTLIALGRAFVDRNKDILEDARFRFEQGYGPAGDIARVDSYVATAEGQVAGFERQLSAASARYAEMFGTEPPPLLDRPPPPATAAANLAAALDLSRTVPLVAAGEARLVDANLVSKAGIAFKDVEALEHQRAALSRAYIANRRTRDLAVEQLSLGAAVRVARAKLEQARRAQAQASVEAATKGQMRAFAEQEITMIEPLVEMGSEPQITLLRARSDARQAAGEQQAALLAIARAGSAVVEASSEVESLEGQYRAKAFEELTAAKVELAGTGRELPALEDRVQRAEIKAPVAGIVNRVLVSTVGGVVKPGEPLVEIVPHNDSLVIEAFVKPADIGFIRPGQRALVKLTAYNFSIYGGLDGRIEYISSDAVPDERRDGESHYIIRVRAENQLRNRGKGRLSITPGMVAEVDILGEKRSILSYLLTPITRLRDNAFREK